MTKWKEISSMEQWNQAKEDSSGHPIVILKHSTACPVSFNALREYEAYLEREPNETVEYRLVKVIESRPVSNQIAADLGVKHESPQIICIKNSENYWNASHYAITDEHMKAVLN